jgi:beta-lactamase regulating signal transducer with metallopeptidase domain
VVDADAPLALTAGLIRPRIYLSSHLLAALAPAELAAVVGHEQAHQRRRDALRLLTAEVLAGLHLPPVRRRLLAALALATERACDEAAARAQADRLTVAAALLAVTRLNAPRPMSADGLLPTVAGADLTARVEALLRPLPVPRVRPWYPVAAAAGALLTIGSIHAAELHHGIESALHVLID